IGEDSPQSRDLRLQRGQASTGRFEPELVEEAVGRDRLVRVEQQVGEERALSRTPEPELLTPHDRLDRAEDSEVHSASSRERTTGLWGRKAEKCEENGRDSATTATRQR